LTPVSAAVYIDFRLNVHSNNRSSDDTAWHGVLSNPALARLGPHIAALIGAAGSRAILNGMNVRSNTRKPAKSATSEHAPRRRGRPVVDDKRRKVLDAALKVFAERGFHGTTVPEVATAAGVGTGTLYHYFEHKHQLVNEVYRDAKLRLREQLLENLPDPDLDKAGEAERWFTEVWHRLASYARKEPDTFKFLEMQDHVEYLDIESRQLEISTIAPLFLVGKGVHDRVGGPRIDVVVALMWGAFVGLVKASRLGYLRLDDESLEQAGATVWRMFEPEATRAAKARPKRG
jgi:AcrR family transcriptional regulator